MKRLSMYARHEAALVELTQAVLVNADPSTLMREAVALVAHTLAVAYSAIWELMPDRSALMLRCGVGWPEAAWTSATVMVAPTSPIGSTALGATPAIVTDWPSETRFQQLPMLRDRGVISSLCVVIPGQVRPFGSLSVDVTASRMFCDEEIHFIEAVANVLALAITRVESNQMLEQRIEALVIENERLIAAAHDQAIMEERQRLARNLHDSVTQALYGVTLHAQAARRLLASGDLSSMADSLRALQDTAQEALDEMRLLIFELRPPILEQVGLAAALQARLHAVEGRANLQTQLIEEGVDKLPSLIEEALYRIALEALNNVLKHAHARHVMAQIQQTETHVMLEISDDGVGFDLAMASETGGMGLRGIAERVTQLDGTLVVQSAPLAGTQLRVEVKI